MKIFLFLGLTLFYVQDFGSQLSRAALSIMDDTIKYDGQYRSIPYPNGDVPAKTGVCTDVIIRAYRKLGFDLQELVHQDMKANFDKYPKVWGERKPNTNIDHRRVLNLQVFFERKGKKLALTKNPLDYQPGDLVTWKIDGKLPHIGIVTNVKSRVDNNRYMIVHNVGRGQVLEDVLFAYDLVGHYQYFPVKK